MLHEIRRVLKASPFLGEAYNKVKARLFAAKGIRVGKNRVLRLMPEHGLLAPVHRGHPRGDRTHNSHRAAGRTLEHGRVAVLDLPFLSLAEGWCWFFVAVDHCALDVVGWHVPKTSDSRAALEPVRQWVTTHFGGFRKASALGFGLRYDSHPAGWTSEV